MSILFDTCDFLWFISGDSALPARFTEPLRNPANELFLSVVSLWEIILKNGLGKLPLPELPEVYIPRQCEQHRILSLDLARIQWRSWGNFQPFTAIRLIEC